MKPFLFALALLLIFSCRHSTESNIPEVSSGKIIRITDFQSGFVDPRNIDVWLPDGYDPDKKYAVIYMHDGQMLFDSTKNWNKQEWQVDETITKLTSQNKIKESIVVGIFNNGEYRMTEYFPMVALMGLQEPTRSSVVKTLLKDKPLSDNYLKFIVEELKPYIDKTYSTFTDPSNTIIMGSSMGGLISVYAFCKYPSVFGGAGCLSTHWPMIGPGVLYNRKIFDNTSAAFREYLAVNMPEPPEGKIYFDYGTETLDSLYKPYQILVDTIMKRSGYNSRSWMTQEFPGENHSEKSWSKRLNIPLEFLLGK
jgi:enterochelin esterase-like enzyme